MTAPKAPFQAPSNVPNPDPTEATIALVGRTVLSFDEKLRLKFETLVVRLDGMEKAVDVAHANNSQVPTLIDRVVGSMCKLQEEKIAALRFEMFGCVGKLETQFRERTTANATAVTAALLAAKETMTKSDAGTTKLIDQSAATVQALNKTFDDKINDLKDRLTTIESRSSGSKDAAGLGLHIIVGLSAIASIVAVVIGLFPHH